MSLILQQYNIALKIAYKIVAFFTENYPSLFLKQELLGPVEDRIKSLVMILIKIAKIFGIVRKKLQKGMKGAARQLQYVTCTGQSLKPKSTGLYIILELNKDGSSAQILFVKLVQLLS